MLKKKRRGIVAFEAQRMHKYISIEWIVGRGGSKNHEIRDSYLDTTISRSRECAGINSGNAHNSKRADQASILEESHTKYSFLVFSATGKIEKSHTSSTKIKNNNKAWTRI